MHASAAELTRLPFGPFAAQLKVDLFIEAHKHFQLPEAYAHAPAGLDTDIRGTAPWLLSPAHQAELPYLGLEDDLTALLKVQSSHNWVSVFLFNSGFADLTVNCIYSYINYGKAHNYVVYAFDDVSLKHCMRFKLPCYNATSLLMGMLPMRRAGGVHLQSAPMPALPGSAA